MYDEELILVRAEGERESDGERASLCSVSGI